MKSLIRAFVALTAVAAISGAAQACHHHRAAMQMMYFAPQPVFMQAPPVMIFDAPAPAPVFFQAPPVQYAPAPVMQYAPAPVQAAESAPVVEAAPIQEPAVMDATPVEVGVEGAVVDLAPAPIVEAAPVEMAPSRVAPGPMNPVQELAPYFYSLEAPLTQQPYAPTPVAAPPVFETIQFHQPAPTFFVPVGPAPRRHHCPFGGCH